MLKTLNTAQSHQKKFKSENNFIDIKSTLIDEFITEKHNFNFNKLIYHEILSCFFYKHIFQR